MTLTFVQNDFYHDTIFWFSRPTMWAQCVLAVVVQVVVVSHVSTDPGHACSGAQGVWPTQLSFLCLTAQSPHTQICLHHQSQQSLFYLLYSETTRQIWRLVSVVVRVRSNKKNNSFDEYFVYHYSFVKHLLYKVQGSFIVNPTIYATYTEHWNYITKRPTV